MKRPLQNHPPAVVALSVSLALIGFVVFTATAHSAESDVSYEHAVVAADHEAASRAGIEILKKGGNVVDAAVATGFALAVVRPASSGLGGGGFMVIWDAKTQKAIALDYREKAPARAKRDMYVDPRNPKQVIPDASQHGALAVAVPGHVAGLCYALREYGTLDLATVLEPAIRLCREGVVIDRQDIAVQQDVLKSFSAHQEYGEKFAVLRRLYANAGKPWAKEDRFYSPLTKVLERIARQGADGFYRGDVAESIVAEVQRGGGLITLADLAAMAPVVREPLREAIGERTILTMPPPSSGGVALLETLNVLSALAALHPAAGLDKLESNSPLYLHVLAEAFKHAFADRAAFLGDADFVKVPVARLTSREYAAELAKRIDLSKTLPPEAYGRFATPDDGGTTHFSILDAAGNAVACTETVNTHFGSYVVEPTFGIVLNNEMDDFTSLPGVPNAFGLIQSEANSIEPGKRPLSSMTPTIVVHDGRAAFVVGASGGPRIITATTQVLLNWIRFSQSPAAAVDAPRIHHQWAPDLLELESEKLPRAELERLGHKIRLRGDSAVVQAASRTNDGRLQGASDRRKGGRAAGY
ncbi:MAG TPA: gamma-glutamyltransferase [Planctomycetaceae bacterium]|jgi:gamma-glutamyltranspeptidase/glutathione hydrolase